MNSPAKLRVFVTGANGMVGHNILEHPATHAWEMITPGRTELNLENAAAVYAFMQETRPHVVIHSAGLVGGIQANISHPVDFLVRNVDIGRNVIMSAVQAGVTTLINLASSCMYPRNGSNPLKEEQILTGELEPTNEGYAIAKIYSTRLCQYLRKENPELHYKTIIPCNLYGRHDKFDPAHSHMIPAVIRKIHEAKNQGADTVEIWGDGLARREFMDAADLADAVVRHVTQGESAPDLMNIGLGHDYTINEYYAAIATTVGWQGCFVHDLNRPVGMRQKLVDTTRQNAWGWSSNISLEQGLARCYAYFLEKVAT